MGKGRRKEGRGREGTKEEKKERKRKQTETNIWVPTKLGISVWMHLSLCPALSWVFLLLLLHSSNLL
jgi:hypothetical protein